MQQITKTHVAEKFRSDAVSNTIDNLRAVICGVDVDTKRTLPESSAAVAMKWLLANEQLSL